MDTSVSPSRQKDLLRTIMKLLKVFIVIIAAAEAITATISNKALQWERFKDRNMRNRHWNLQRSRTREGGKGISVSQFKTAMSNVAAKLEQRRRAMLTFRRMLKVVNANEFKSAE